MSEEIHRLEHHADSAFESVNSRFQGLLDAVEEERQLALAAVRRKRDEKKKVLEEQIGIIKQERNKVDQDVKVRDILGTYVAIMLVNVTTLVTLAEPPQSREAKR